MADDQLLVAGNRHSILCQVIFPFLTHELIVTFSCLYYNKSKKNGPIFIYTLCNSIFVAGDTNVWGEHIWGKTTNVNPSFLGRAQYVCLDFYKASINNPCSPCLWSDSPSRPSAYGSYLWLWGGGWCHNSLFSSSHSGDRPVLYLPIIRNSLEVVSARFPPLGGFSYLCKCESTVRLSGCYPTAFASLNQL